MTPNRKHHDVQMLCLIFVCLAFGFKVKMVDSYSCRNQEIMDPVIITDHTEAVEIVGCSFKNEFVFDGDTVVIQNGDANFWNRTKHPTATVKIAFSTFAKKMTFTGANIVDGSTSFVVENNRFQDRATSFADIVVSGKGSKLLFQGNTFLSGVTFYLVRTIQQASLELLDNTLGHWMMLKDSPLHDGALAIRNLSTAPRASSYYAPLGLRFHYQAIPLFAYGNSTISLEDIHFPASKFVLTSHSTYNTFSKVYHIYGWIGEESTIFLRNVSVNELLLAPRDGGTVRFISDIVVEYTVELKGSSSVNDRRTPTLMIEDSESVVFGTLQNSIVKMSTVSFRAHASRTDHTLTVTKMTAAKLHFESIKVLDGNHLRFSKCKFGHVVFIAATVQNNSVLSFSFNDWLSLQHSGLVFLSFEGMTLFRNNAMLLLQDETFTAGSYNHAMTFSAPSRGHNPLFSDNSTLLIQRCYMRRIFFERTYKSRLYTATFTENSRFLLEDTTIGLVDDGQINFNAFLYSNSTFQIGNNASVFGKAELKGSAATINVLEWTKTGHDFAPAVLGSHETRISGITFDGDISEAPFDLFSHSLIFDCTSCAFKNEAVIVVRDNQKMILVNLRSCTFRSSKFFMSNVTFPAKSAVCVGFSGTVPSANSLLSFTNVDASACTGRSIQMDNSGSTWIEDSAMLLTNTSLGGEFTVNNKKGSSYANSIFKNTTIVFRGTSIKYRIYVISTSTDSFIEFGEGTRVGGSVFVQRFQAEVRDDVLLGDQKVEFLHTDFRGNVYFQNQEKLSLLKLHTCTFQPFRMLLIRNMTITNYESEALTMDHTFFTMADVRFNPEETAFSSFAFYHSRFTNSVMCIRNCLFGGNRHSFLVWHKTYQTMIFNSTLSIANSTFLKTFATTTHWTDKSRGCVATSRLYNTTLDIANSSFASLWHPFEVDLDQHSTIRLHSGTVIDNPYFKSTSFTNRLEITSDDVVLGRQVPNAVMKYSLRLVGFVFESGAAAVFRGETVDSIEFNSVTVTNGSTLALIGYNGFKTLGFIGTNIISQQGTLLFKNLTSLSETAMDPNQKATFTLGVLVMDSFLILQQCVLNSRRRAVTFTSNDVFNATADCLNNASIVIRNSIITGDVVNYHTYVTGSMSRWVKEYGFFSDDSIILLQDTIINVSQLQKAGLAPLPKMHIVLRKNSALVFEKNVTNPGSLEISGGEVFACDGCVVAGAEVRLSSVLFKNGNILAFPPALKKVTLERVVAQDNGGISFARTFVEETVDVKASTFKSNGHLFVLGGNLSKGIIFASTRFERDGLFCASEAAIGYEVTRGQSVVFFTSTLDHAIVDVADCTTGPIVNIYQKGAYPYRTVYSTSRNTTVIVSKNKFQRCYDYAKQVHCGQDYTVRWQLSGDDTVYYGQSNTVDSQTSKLEVIGANANNKFVKVSPTEYDPSQATFTGSVSMEELQDPSGYQSIQALHCNKAKGNLLQSHPLATSTSLQSAATSASIFTYEPFKNTAFLSIAQESMFNADNQKGRPNSWLDHDSWLRLQCPSTPPAEEGDAPVNPSRTPSISFSRTVAAPSGISHSATIPSVPPSDTTHMSTMTGFETGLSTSSVPTDTTDVVHDSTAAAPLSNQTDANQSTHATSIAIVEDPLTNASSSQSPMSVAPTTNTTADDDGESARSTSVVLTKIFQSKTASTAVVSVSALSLLASATVSPQSASQLSRVAVSLHTVDCFFDEEDIEPSHVEFPLHPPLGTSKFRYYNGGIVITCLLIGALFVTHRFLWRWFQKHQRLSNALQVVGIAWSVLLLYFFPTVVTNAVMIGIHGVDTTDRIIGGVFLTMAISAVGYLSWLLTNRFDAKEKKKAKNAFGQDAETLSATSSNRKLVFVDKTKNSGFVNAWKAVFDGAKSTAKLIVRLYFVEELVSAGLLGIISGLRPGKGNCSKVAAAVCAVSLAHLVYLSYIRPLRTRSDTSFSIFFALLEFFMGILCLVTTLSMEKGDGNPSEKNLKIIAACIFIQVIGFFVQTVVQAYWVFHTRSRSEARSRMARGGGLENGGLDVSSSDEDDEEMEEDEDRSNSSSETSSSTNTTSSASSSMGGGTTNRKRGAEESGTLQVPLLAEGAESAQEPTTSNPLLHGMNDEDSESSTTASSRTSDSFLYL